MVRAKKLFRLVGWLYTVKKLEAGFRSQVSCKWPFTVYVRGDVDNALILIGAIAIVTGAANDG